MKLFVGTLSATNLDMLVLNDHAKEWHLSAAATFDLLSPNMMKQFSKLVLNKVINYDISFKMSQQNAMINVMKRFI